jgi:transposase
MFVQFKGSGKNKLAYIAKSYRLKKGDKTSTVIVKKLGYLHDIAEAHPDVDPMEWARQQAKEMTEQEKSQKQTVKIELSPVLSIKKGHQRNIHGGMLPLIPIYHQWLGLDKICKEISARRSFKFDLSEILQILVYGRILCPDSKLGTLQQAATFIKAPKVSLDDVYRSLSVLSAESDFIQKEIYNSTMQTEKRNTGIIYYDCSNYYFEIESQDCDIVNKKGAIEYGLRKYGHSKENRPNPIVQLGLFMDADGMPLAFCINPGNTPETQTIVPLEEKLANNFKLSDFVCCTDGGLGSRDVRKYNTTEGRHYITVQSLKDKKCDPNVQKWALQDGNWHIPGYKGEYTLAEAAKLLGDKFRGTTLHKDQYYKVGKGNMQLEEHYIVTYSQKYADYQRQTRQEQIARAQTKIDRGESTRPKSPNDCRRFIATTHATKDGEVAEFTDSVIDQNKVADEARFDGLYALATSLDDTPTAVLRANHFRYEIEALFRITKTNLELRPIYLQRKDRITGHFIVCFIALLMIKKLQKQLKEPLQKQLKDHIDELRRQQTKHNTNEPQSQQAKDNMNELQSQELDDPIIKQLKEQIESYSVENIIDQLRSIKYLLLEAQGYIPTFDRTDMLDNMQYTIKQRIDREIISKPAMRALVRELAKG